MENIYNRLAEIFEVDAVSDDQILKEFECWDSLTVLSVIALASEHYNATLSANEINDTRTIEGLVELIMRKAATT